VEGDDVLAVGDRLQTGQRATLVARPGHGRHIGGARRRSEPPAEPRLEPGLATPLQGPLPAMEESSA